LVGADSSQVSLKAAANLIARTARKEDPPGADLVAMDAPNSGDPAAIANRKLFAH
jgi:hypothetical protein